MSTLNDPRVLFAAERTLLAWNRTSLAFIAFGFVIERTGLLLELLSDVHIASSYDFLTLLLGLGFIVLGAFCAILSAYQFNRVLKTLSPEEVPEGYMPRWGAVINLIVSGFALVLAVLLSMQLI